MDQCGFSPDDNIGSTNITWGQATAIALKTPQLIEYLRPNSGAALLPWVYSVVVVILHLPTVLIRVVRWELVQYWCLVSTFFTIVVYTQAYVSTRFDPAKVLLWTPIILVIDAGSMLQIVFLVWEAKKEDKSSKDDLTGLTLTTSHVSSLLGRARARRKSKNSSIGELEPFAQTMSQDVKVFRWYRDPATYSAGFAALFFLAILILQVWGLAKAAESVGQTPLVSWCSPAFEPWPFTILDGDCHVYDVYQSQHSGIGCINLPGVWQQQWLKGTVAGVSIELALEVLDLAILSLVSGTKKYNGVKMKRPWTTMFSGIVVLIVTLLYAVFYATSLPPGITERVTVFQRVQGPASYEVLLSSAGLRGGIIGWNDGLFESWQSTYSGAWVNWKTSGMAQR